MEEDKKKWGGARTGSGRPVGWRKDGATGRKKLFSNMTISGTPEETDKIKQLAEAAGKSVSCFVIETLLNK